MSEGGLARKFAVALLGPGYGHWRYFGPEYRAEALDDGWRITLDGRTRHFGSLSGCLPAGGTIHILLSGPSVSTIERPQRLVRAPSITVNGSYRALNAPGFEGRSDLYVVSDVGFVRRQWASFVDGVRAARAVALDHRVLIEVVRRDPALVAATDIRVFDNLRRPYGRSSRFWRDPPADVVCRGRKGAFSTNVRHGFHPSGTVGYLALQIAAAQRPARIVLFGLDLTDGPRFYPEDRPEKAMLMLDLHQTILPDFALAAGVLRAQGIEVINASPDSVLADTVFPRRDPNAVLANSPDG